MIAHEVMLDSSILLNDSAQSVFTDTVLLPYLKIAYDELREFLEENNVPVTNETSDVLVITTAMFDIGGNTGPALPQDLIEIQSLNERANGTSDSFLPMVRKDFLPMITTLISSLTYWSWQQQVIRLLGATTSRDVKINYVGRGLANIDTPNSVIGLLNSKIPLAYRTAGLAAEYIGENPDRAASLNEFAGSSLERMLNITTKGRQAISTRRRPFRSGYKARGSW